MPPKKEPPKEPKVTKAKKGAKKGTTGSSSKLANASDLINKILGKDNEDCIVSIDPEQFKVSHAFIPTTSIILDQLISGRQNSRGVNPCPGWPRAKFIQLYGMESSGKTTTALHMAKSVIDGGGCVGYIDFEQDIVPEYARSLGIPVDNENKFRLFQPSTFEEGAQIMWVLATAAVDLLIIDSIPAAVPKALVEKRVQEIGDKGQIGVNASQWAAFLPRLRPLCRKNGVTLLGISQIRASISQYGPPETVPGGNAWKFYSSLRMRLQKKKVITESVYNALTNEAEDKPIGQWVTAKLDKCKVSAQQGAEALFFIRFGEGIDNLASLLEIGEAHKIIKKDGSWFTWIQPGGEEAKFQGKEKLYAFVKADPARAAALEKQIRPFLTPAAVKQAQAVVDEDEDEEDLDENEVDEDDLASVMASIAETTNAELAKAPSMRVADRISMKMGEQSLGDDED